MELPLIDDYRRLFLDDVPLLDVRAPVEFAEGAFPQATNLPLLSDEERHLIGIRYKEAGPDAAVELGRELVDGEPRRKRTQAWVDYVRRHPHGVLYCFRGGQRSRIVQAWIHQASGIAYPRVKGGYKALRRFLLQELDAAADELQPLILGGRTGVGKTLLIKTLDKAVDLEGLAWHRGSAFGRHATPQPTQIDFENRLSIALLKARARGDLKLVLEDEGKAIGSRHLPPRLHELMSRSPVVILEASLEERVHNSVQEYVTEALAEYCREYGHEEGFQRWADYACNSLDRIRKRLGGQRHKEMAAELRRAIDAMAAGAGPEVHAGWIARLLTEYYDPMYDYQLRNKRERICFSGDRQAVTDYLSERLAAG